MAELKFGVSISQLSSEASAELASEAMTNNFEYINLSDSRGIVIPVNEDIGTVIEPLAFADEDLNIKLKFAVYCKDDHKFYEDNLLINENSARELGESQEILREGFSIDDFAELLDFFIKNPDMVNQDLKNIEETYYTKPSTINNDNDSSAEDANSKTVKEDISDKSGLDEVNALLNSDSKNDSKSSVESAVKENKENTMSRTNYEDVPKLATQEQLGNKQVELPQFDNKLLKRATEIVDDAEGSQIIPEYDDFTKKQLLPDLVEYQNKLGTARNNTVIEVYNRLIDVKKRVETQDLREKLYEAQKRHEETLEKIDTREKQTDKDIETRLNNEYSERKSRYVSSMRPTLEAEFDAKNLENHHQNIQTNKNKNKVLSQQARDDEDANYEKYIDKLKSKAVDEAIKDVNVDDILEKLDQEIDQELNKLEALAKKFDLEQSDNYKKLFDEKESIQKKSDEKDLKIALLEKNMDHLRDSFDTDVESQVNMRVAQETRNLQIENSDLTDKLQRLQKSVTEKTQELEQEKLKFQAELKEEQEKSKAKLEEEQAKSKAVMDNLKAKQQEIETQQQQMLKLQSSMFQGGMLQQPQAAVTQTTDKKEDTNQSKTSSNWGKNVLFVTASVAILALTGIGGYTMLHSHNDATVTQSQSVSVSKDESSKNSSSSSSAKISTSSSVSESSSSESKENGSTVLSIDNPDVPVGKEFMHTLPNGDTVSILRTSQNAGQYTDKDGHVQSVFIKN
ncbi:hypothetical protein [Ligilactobacillus salivarius]|nr:hypothetical protein [Ligilactobacillus salivarius]